ncbi:MAG: hypothetical protein QOD78_628, partial [Chloroflexota bacterium]|nr:hypothetical protein [Chloroflexota bacterium]
MRRRPLIVLLGLLALAILLPMS